MAGKAGKYMSMDMGAKAVMVPSSITMPKVDERVWVSVMGGS